MTHRTITLAVELPAPPERLFEMYLDAETHAAFTGSAVRIEPRAGTHFSAFDGILTGTLLHVEPPRMLVQTWRSAKWPADALDSILVLTFHETADGGRIELVHANIHDDDFAGICDGWHRRYWEPWRAYLTSDE